MKRTKKDLQKQIKKLKEELKEEKNSRSKDIAETCVLLFDEFNKRIKELEDGKVIAPIHRVRMCFLSAGEYEILIDPAKLLLGYGNANMISNDDFNKDHPIMLRRIR